MICAFICVFYEATTSFWLEFLFTLKHQCINMCLQNIKNYKITYSCGSPKTFTSINVWQTWRSSLIFFCFCGATLHWWKAEQIETLLHLPVCTSVFWPGPGVPLCSNSMFLRACCCRIILFASEYFLDDRCLANRCCSAGPTGSYFRAHPFGAVSHGSKRTHPQLSGCFFLSVSHRWELWSYCVCSVFAMIQLCSYVSNFLELFFQGGTVVQLRSIIW